MNEGLWTYIGTLSGEIIGFLSNYAVFNKTIKMDKLIKSELMQTVSEIKLITT
jgi:hypothetical protein